MNLFLRDLKANLKPLIIWIISLFILILILVVAYPVAIEKMKSLDEVLASMPKELLLAFNLESYDWSIALNYLAYEFQYIFVAASIFAVTLAAGIFSKEETNKTISLIYSKPITRKEIFISKVLNIYFILVLFNLLLFVITYISLKIGIKDQVIVIKDVFNLYLALFIIQSVFASIGSFIAITLKNPKAAAIMTSGIVIFSYMLGMFSKIAEFMNKFIYVSPLHYFLPDQIVRTGVFELKYLVISLSVIVILIGISFAKYNKKDFNI